MLCSINISEWALRGKVQICNKTLKHPEMKVYICEKGPPTGGFHLSFCYLSGPVESLQYTFGYIGPHRQLSSDNISFELSRWLLLWFFFCNFLIHFLLGMVMRGRLSYLFLLNNLQKKLIREGSWNKYISRGFLFICIFIIVKLFYLSFKIILVNSILSIIIFVMLRLHIVFQKERFFLLQQYYTFYCWNL